jgi:hypothetical protein
MVCYFVHSSAVALSVCQTSPPYCWVIYTSLACSLPVTVLFPCRLPTGVWPEFALLNHSCAPNTVPPVLLKDRLLLRSALNVPVGEELTASYLGLAGGLPLQQRRQLLQLHYGFTCRCHRCKVRAGGPCMHAAAEASFAAITELHMPTKVQPLLCIYCRHLLNLVGPCNESRVSACLL